MEPYLQLHGGVRLELRRGESLQISGELNFPVVERLKQGLNDRVEPVLQLHGGVRLELRRGESLHISGESNFPVAERLNKGLTTAWSPT